MEFIDLKTQHDAISQSVHDRIASVFKHGQYIMGPEVSELEGRLANFTGSKHCVTTASGTDALLISLLAIGVKPGDEVITSPFTFAATAEAIVLCGGTPVYVDIDPDTCNIDPSLIEPRVTERTRAIIPVSLYGQPSDMDEINDIAASYSIPVIEDAAQSFGAQYRGRASCNLSSIGCTSFFPSKPLGCYGDGGALFTNDDQIAETCREIRSHGQRSRYLHTRIGLCGRMDTIQCAVVLAKMDVFPAELSSRQSVAERYNNMLNGRVRPLVQRPDRTSVLAQYTVLTDDREAVRQRCQAAGIPTAVHYPVPLNEQPAYKHLPGANFVTPVAKYMSNRVLSLPMSPYLSPSDQEKVVQVVNQHPA